MASEAVHVYYAAKQVAGASVFSLGAIDLDDLDHSTSDAPCKLRSLAMFILTNINQDWLKYNFILLLN